MRTVLMAAALGLALGCAGDDYDGPGRDLVGDWPVAKTSQVTVHGTEYETTGLRVTLSIYPGDGVLVVEDDDCAYPAEGDGSAGLRFLPNDSCILPFGSDLFRYQVVTGWAALSSTRLTVEFSGKLDATADSTEGSFNIFYQGDRD